MLQSLTSLLSGLKAQPSEKQLRDREWSRLLSEATSQNERDEINDLFTGSFAA
jgi:hypothetical protein